mmetsp:Transcript_26796/g.48583  ORF Transcript_26796/g.48583 Transcript_26796/m.48583 type:complete len:85 (+) Transcript_26796:66-320(+)
MKKRMIVKRDHDRSSELCRLEGGCGWKEAAEAAGRRLNLLLLELTHAKDTLPRPPPVDGHDHESTIYVHSFFFRCSSSPATIPL